MAGAATLRCTVRCLRAANLGETRHRSDHKCVTGCIRLQCGDPQSRALGKKVTSRRAEWLFRQELPSLTQRPHAMHSPSPASACTTKRGNHKSPRRSGPGTRAGGRKWEARTSILGKNMVSDPFQQRFLPDSLTLKLEDFIFRNTGEALLKSFGR